jgi:hypothetical protein
VEDWTAAPGDPAPRRSGDATTVER